MHDGPDQLRDWMKRRGLNQQKTAEFLGMSEVFISQILRGHRRPALANAVHIERKTGIVVESWLLTEISDSPDESVGDADNAKIARR